MYSPEQIYKIAESMQNLSEEEAQTLIEKFSAEQPFVLGYSVASGETFENPEHAENLMSLVVLVWMVYDKNHDKLPQVPQEMIFTFEKEHYAELTAIEQKSGEDYENALQDMVASRKQPVLSDFVNQEIVHSFDKEAGAGFAILNVVISSFEQVALKATSV